MDLFSPLRFGVRVAADAARLATFVPRALIKQLTDDDSDRPQSARPHRDGAPAATRSAAGPARGGTGRRPVGPDATPGRATDQEGSVERTAGPPEPTAAAGASGGVAGTMDAPGDAAAVDAPDPTVARTNRDAPTAPRAERRENDVRAAPAPRERTTVTEDVVVESEGAASPGAQLHVDAPWDGYDGMKAADIVTRLQSADDSTKAVVRLYEQLHKKRKSILSATQ